MKSREKTAYLLWPNDREKEKGGETEEQIRIIS